jgi:hypothetical protein
MRLQYIRYAASAATLLGAAQAQSIVPSDLATAFSSGSELQVAYGVDGVNGNGFKDGTTFQTTGR